MKTSFECRATQLSKQNAEKPNATWNKIYFSIQLHQENRISRFMSGARVTLYVLRWITPQGLEFLS